MAGSLLTHHIQTLRLRPKAPFNLKAMLKEWRRERVPLDLPVHDRDTPDDPPLSDMGCEES